MKRLMIVARLRDDAHDDAEVLLREGPPFDPEELGLERHAAYLTAGEVVFVFEAREVEWIVNDLIDDPAVAAFFAPWQPLVEGTPRLLFLQRRIRASGDFPKRCLGAFAALRQRDH